MRARWIIVVAVFGALIGALYFEAIYVWVMDVPTTAVGAVYDGDLERLREMAVVDPKVLEAVDSSGHTLLHLAARECEPEIVEYLLAQGLDPGARDRFNATPLHEAAQDGAAKAAQLLLKSDPTIIEAADDLGRTALHIAAGGFRLKPVGADRVSVAKILIENGANLHARNNSGETPLHCAARRGSAAAAKLLIEAGADPAVRVENYNQQPDERGGISAMQIAAHYGNYEVVKLLLEHGAPVISLQNPEREIYVSALHSACAPYLEQYRNGNGEFPEDLTFPREMKTIDLLLARVRDPNIVAKSRYMFEGTPLQIAASQSDIRIVRQLIENYPRMIVPTDVRLADRAMNSFLSRAANRQKEQWAQSLPNTAPAIVNLGYQPPSEGLDAGGYLTGTIQDETRRPARYRVEIDFDGNGEIDVSGRYPADDWGFSYQIQMTAGDHELWVRVLEDDIYQAKPLASQWKHFEFIVAVAPNKRPWSYGFSYDMEGNFLDIRGGLTDLTGQNSEYRVEVDSDGDGRSDLTLSPVPSKRPWTKGEWQVYKSFKTSIEAPSEPQAVRVRIIELRGTTEVARTDWIEGECAADLLNINGPSDPARNPVVAPKPWEPLAGAVPTS